MWKISLIRCLEIQKMNNGCTFGCVLKRVFLMCSSGDCHFYFPIRTPLQYIVRHLSVVCVQLKFIVSERHLIVVFLSPKTMFHGH